MIQAYPHQFTSQAVYCVLSSFLKKLHTVPLKGTFAADGCIHFIIPSFHLCTDQPFPIPQGQLTQSAPPLCNTIFV